MKTAVVLAAGGIVGQAFHLGVLGCLAEATGFDARRADVLVGSSAGSMVAAGLAGGLSVADLRAEMLGEPLSEEGRRIRGTRRAMPRMPTPEPLPAGRGPLAVSALLHAARRPWAVRPGALASSLLPPGSIGTDLIARSVQHLHGSAWPDRDLRITAVRARDSQRVVFGAPGAPRGRRRDGGRGVLRHPVVLRSRPGRWRGLRRRRIPLAQQRRRRAGRLRPTWSWSARR